MSSRDLDRGRDLISAPGFSPAKEASTSFQAPLGGQDRGVAWPLVRVRTCPPLPVGKGDVSLEGGPKRHLSCAPKGRRTPLRLGALRVCSRPLPRLIPGGSRHQRRGGFPHISPTPGPASRRTGAVSNGPHTGQGEPPAARSALPLQGPFMGYPCGPPPDSGPSRGPMSPSHLGIQNNPRRWGDRTTRVSRGHPLRHEVGQRRERVSGVLPPSSPTSCPAHGWDLSDFFGAPSRAVRWRRPMRPKVRPQRRSIVAAVLLVTSSGRRRRLTAPWPPSCRLLGRLPPSLTTLFAGSPGTSGGPW